MSDLHSAEAVLKKLHQPKDGAKEKGCVWGSHQRRTKTSHKCSHQWQAKQKALDHKDMYGYKKYKKFCGKGTFKSAGFTRQRPKEGDWDVDKPGNFDHALKPYWHNAHHIVPNGAFKNSINKEGERDSRLPNLIRQGLLRAEYNINDKINMVILPQGRTEGLVLGLPRHLKRDEIGPNETPEFYSHKDYSNLVEKKLDKAMKKYRKMFSSYLKQKHPPSPNKLAKTKIEKISKDIFKEIENLAKKYAGKALSQIPTLVKGA